VHAEALVVVIDTVHEDAFPRRVTAGEKTIGAQGLQDHQGGGLIALSFVRRTHGFREIPQTAGCDGSGGALEDARTVFRDVEIPRGDEGGWRVPKVIFGTMAGRVEKLGFAAQSMRRRKAVDGPGQASRPSTAGVPSLVRALPQESAGFHVEYAFVSRAAVGPH